MSTKFTMTIRIDDSDALLKGESSASWTQAEGSLWPNFNEMVSVLANLARHQGVTEKEILKIKQGTIKISQ
jgi:hypothetical protein